MSQHHFTYSANVTGHTRILHAYVDLETGDGPHIDLPFHLTGEPGRMEGSRHAMGQRKVHVAVDGAPLGTVREATFRQWYVRVSEQFHTQTRQQIEQVLELCGDTEVTLEGICELTEAPPRTSYNQPLEKTFGGATVNYDVNTTIYGQKHENYLTITFGDDVLLETRADLTSRVLRQMDVSLDEVNAFREEYGLEESLPALPNFIQRFFNRGPEDPQPACAER